MCMISRRMSTQLIPEPPVRFYKFIALSFLVITVALLAIVIFVTSKKAEIIIVAKEDSKDVNLTAKVVSQNPGQYSILGAVTSSLFKWSEKYHPTGNKKVEGIATGEVILYNNTSAAQPLVRTTRLVTADGIMFRLSNSVVVPANGQITTSVYADRPGIVSDIGPSKFKIPGLNITKQQVIYAESAKPMTGGEQTIGVLSDEDIKNAEDDYNQKVKEAYRESLSVPEESEIAISLNEQNIASDQQVGEEVAEFTISGTNRMVAVTYNAEDLANLESRQIFDKVDTSVERFLSLDKKPQVSVGSYNLREGTAELLVRQNVVVTLDANGEKLAVSNFLGKGKEEIERYVLGLDHVSRVDVNFSPGWASSAPTTPDKIRVVVKNVD